jgi:hypothetical protein
MNGANPAIFSQHRRRHDLQMATTQTRPGSAYCKKQRAL